MNKNIVNCLTVVIIFSIVFFMGCIEKETITSPVTPTIIATPKEIPSSVTSIPPNDEQKQLREIKHFIDPQLEKIPIISNNPNIEIISYKLYDNRTFEEDTNWRIELVVQNNAKVPVWITSPFMNDGQLVALSPNHGPAKYTNKTRYNIAESTIFYLLGSGERKIFNFERGMGSIGGIRKWQYSRLKYLEMEAYNTVEPKVSDEIKNLQLRAFIDADIDGGMSFDIHSIKYEKDERDWKYIVFEISNPRRQGSMTIYPTTKDKGGVHYLKQGGKLYLIIGERLTCKISLEDYNPEDVYVIDIKSELAEKRYFK